MEENEYMNEATYMGERKMLIDLLEHQSHAYDKTLIASAAGALGLSMTFMDRIAPEPTKICLLIISWSLLVLTLLIVLLSMLFSQGGLEKQRCILDKTYEEQCDPVCTKNWQSFAAKVCNYFAMGFFIAGVAFLLIFSIANLNLN